MPIAAHDMSETSLSSSINLSSSIKSTIVIGGGLAGIAAALSLAKRGVKVTLLESRQRLGGRAGSFTLLDDFGVEIQTVDYCQHVGMGCCHNLKKLIQWLGQKDDWHEHRQLHFFGPHGDYQRLGAWPIVPAPLHLAGWLLKWPHLRLRDRASIARGMWAVRKLPLNSQTASQPALDWLQLHGQTPAAIEHFWSTIIVSALGEELSRVSLAAVAKVLQDGFLKHRDAFHLLVPQRPLAELFGTQAVHCLKQQGVELHLATPVTSLAQLTPEALRVDTSQSSLEADSVILAVPWHQLSKIRFVDDRCGLSALASIAGQLQSSSITGVHTWWDRPWLNLPHAAIVGRLCQWVFPKPTLVFPSATASVSQRQVYYQIVISASQALRGAEPEKLASAIHEDLQKVFPAARGARLLKYKVVTDPQAVFSITPQAHLFRPEPGVGPRIAVAGDWTQTGWPATMEGAILSGFKAAEHILWI